MTGKIILPGGAGLVGQNLVARLRARGYSDVVVLDKHRANLATLRRMQPAIHAEFADLAVPGEWQQHFAGAQAVVMLQAQIGGNDLRQFVRNSIDSTRLILAEIRRYAIPKTVHISSSVVESLADDFYTNTKNEQEHLVLDSGLRCVILRPTLMFGWFDRKHLGWLSRFMHRMPVFPIPGNGRYPRQPLYAGDFCEIIISCIERDIPAGAYNISGLQRVDYIDIIREIKRATGARAAIVPIPYRIFHTLLWLWGLVDRNPPFTTQQLEALAASDEFEIIDWPGIFGVTPTPLRTAIDITFSDPAYSTVALDF